MLSQAIPSGPTLENSTSSLDPEVITHLVNDDILHKYDYKNQELVVKNMRSKQNKNYAVKFRAGNDALNNPDIPSNEMNLIFMGTGGSLHFGASHKDVYEGGDVLCHLGLHKGIEQAQPTFLVRGIGTTDFNSALDFIDDPEKNTQGSTVNAVIGIGGKTRITLAMEQFVVPTLLQMINKKINKNEVPCDLTFNIVGHSRGGICSYAVASLVDAWLKDIQNMDDEKIRRLAGKIAQEFAQMTSSKPTNGVASETRLNTAQIVNALKAIRDNQAKLQTKLMAYDPVEGMLGIGDYLQSTASTEIFGKKYTYDYRKMPASVKEAKIFIATDERRDAFQPTIAQNTPSTTVAICPVLGVHGTLKGYFSRHDDLGQYSYYTVKNSIFLQEALRASADLVKINSTRFIFDALPVFDKVTLYNIFYANNTQGYVKTKAHFMQAFEKLLQVPNEDFIALLGQETIENIKNNGLSEVLTHKEWIHVCEWMMQHNQKFTKQLYADVERDIHEIYLSPKDKNKLKMLNRLRAEMRADTTTLAPALKLIKQSSNENRNIWMQNDEGIHLQSLTEAFSHLAYDPMQALLHPGASLGWSMQDRIYDIYYFNMLNIFTQDELAHLLPEEKEILNELNDDFADLNQKGALYSTNKTSTVLEKYENARAVWIYKINTAHIPEAIKIKLFSVLIMKEIFLYRINSTKRISAAKVGKLYHPSVVAALDYQLNQAIRFSNHKLLNKAPKLYKAMFKLTEHVADSINEIDLSFKQGLETKLKKIQEVIKEPGIHILRNGLLSQLKHYEDMIKETENLLNTLIAKSKKEIELIEQDGVLHPQFNELELLKNKYHNLSNEKKTCAKFTQEVTTLRNKINDFHDMQQVPKLHFLEKWLSNLLERIYAFKKWINTLGSDGASDKKLLTQHEEQELIAPSKTLISSYEQAKIANKTDGKTKQKKKNRPDSHPK